MTRTKYRVVEPDEANKESLDEKMDLQKVDEVLAGLGNFGKFQLKIFLISVLMAFLACWRIILDLFAAKYCPWKCTELGLSMNCTDSGLAGILPCDVPSNSVLDSQGDAEGLYWQYDTNHSANSIVSTYGIPCSERWKISFTSSIYFIGAFFGVWLLGLLSDAIGRFLTMVISLVMCIVPAWIMPFIPQISAHINYPIFSKINIYLGCRCLDGAAFGGYFMSIFVLMMEYTAPRQRSKSGTLLQVAGSLAMATISVVGYIFPRLDHYLISLAVIPTVTLVIVLFCVPESARWVLSKGRDERALVLLRNVAVSNGKELPKNVRLYEVTGVRSGYRDLAKNWLLLRSTAINMSGWFITSLVYYMLWFGAKYLSGNIYLNAFVLGIAEIPGRAMAYVLMEKVGRKKAFMGALTLASVVMLISIYEDSTLRKVMYCIGKSVAGLLWGVIYIYTTEIYPTNVRGLGAGVGSGAARVAAFLAPFVGEVSRLGGYVPYVTVAGLALVCLSVFWMLPETRGRDLPQTLEEFEGLFEEKRYEEMTGEKGEEDRI